MVAQKEVGDKQLEELKEASNKAPVEDVSIELKQQLETTKQVSLCVHVYNNVTCMQCVQCVSTVIWEIFVPYIHVFRISNFRGSKFRTHGSKISTV